MVSTAGVCASLLVLLSCACEIVPDIAELDDAGGLAEAEAALRNGEPATALRATLENAALEGGTVRIARTGEIVRAGSPMGRLTSAGDIFLRSTSGSEALAGRVLDGRIWSMDGGGNVVAVAEIRGAPEAGVALRAQPSLLSPTVEVLTRDITLDVLRVREGWYEVRIRGEARTGWIPASRVAVLLASTSSLPQQLVQDVCGSFRMTTSMRPRSNDVAQARYDNARVRASSEPGFAPPAVWSSSVGGHWVLILHSTHASDSAGALAGRLSRLGANVEHAAVDTAAAALCGGEIFYAPRDLEAAQAIQAAAVDITRLRVSSTESASTLTVWIP